MIELKEDIRPLSEFKRDSAGMMKRVRKNGRPLVLTVKGKAEAIVLDPAVYEEVAQHLDTIAAIRRGLAQAKAGQGLDVGEFFNELDQRA